MLEVGLTGNIASGKSTVADVWRELGAWIVNADELARRAVEPGSAGLRQIVDRWGNEIVDSDGRLDRDAMRSVAFADPAARAELEAIIHPRVAELRDEAFAEARRAGAPVVVADVPLLFEVGMEDRFDVVVLVDAPEALRRERIVRDRGLTPDEADRMISAQMPSSPKRVRSDLLIDNDRSLSELRTRAREVWSEVLRRAEATA